jgi:ATP synthase protein I
LDYFRAIAIGQGMAEESGDKGKAPSSLKEERKKFYKQAMRYSAVGLEMGFSVAIGVAVGYFLDKYFHTSPWLLLIFLILGIVAGFRSLFSLITGLDKNERKK